MTNNLAKSVELVNFVERFVREKRSFSAQTSILLAVSGGQDSTCLTAIMAQLQSQWGIRLGTISCNHLWQEDSFYSSFHVARVCFLLKQSFSFLPAARNFTLSNEGEARVWRQNNTRRVASFYQYPAISTGHTGSDRVETMLFNLIRGCGKRGLSSLYWSRFITTCSPDLCYLSNFDSSGVPQKERFVWPTVITLSKDKRAAFRQICVLYKRGKAVLQPRSSCFFS
jgi:tRNA(Ile)-lysidine synthetase-like protein